jgi:hypothetical protein
MPKRKLSEQKWRDLCDAYDAWDPSDSSGHTIDDVLEPYGLSKQAFYAERRKRGMPTKGGRSPASKPARGPEQAMAVMLELLVSCKIRNRVLEDELKSHGLRVP